MRGESTMVRRKGHAMSRMGKSFLVALVFACAALTASTSAQVVINEIHYNPVSANAEFIEFYTEPGRQLPLRLA